jgi:ribose-phosphate pyrophosphokinase
MPFYGYARQDRKDQPRVPITAKLVANLLTAAGANRVLTMDLHSQQIQGFFFDIPVDHLYASPTLFKYLAQTPNSNLVVCSPDVGGMKMAAAYADVLGAGLGLVAKKRTSATNVEAINVVGDVKGCDVLLVDDITETAGTLTASRAGILREHGARSVRAAVSHCILSDMARAASFRGIDRRTDHHELDSQRSQRPADHDPEHGKPSRVKRSFGSTTTRVSPSFSR